MISMTAEPVAPPVAVVPLLGDILPYSGGEILSQGREAAMLRNVAVVLVDGFQPFEFGTICEVFGIDRSDDGLPGYDFAVVAGEPAPVRADLGFTIQPSFGLERLEEADLIALPAVGDGRLAHGAGPQFPAD